MSDILYFDGVDVDDLGLSVSALPGAHSAPTMTYATAKVPLRPGVVVTQGTPDTDAFLIRAQVLSINDSASASETAIQTFKDALSGRLVAIKYGFASTRSRFGLLQPFDAELEFPGQLDGNVMAAVAFLCPDPFAIDNDPTVTGGITGERVPVQVGTGPTYPYVQIVGPTTGTVTLTARDHAGNPLGTMAFSTSLAADDLYVIETVNGGRAWHHDAGVIVSAMGLLTAGYTFPVFEPRHADRANNDWPTLETDKGSLVVTYARRWR